MGRIVTFYSYKGGVGRTFALANVAVLLAKWGHRVLCVDWDLEAPGLVQYFHPATVSRRSARLTVLGGAASPLARYAARPRLEISGGVLDVVTSVAEAEPVAWQDVVTTVEGDDWTLDLLAAGKPGEDYVRRLHGLDWNRLYREHDLGWSLEAMRAQWLSAYDFVLVDSRTGLTDIGGICAAQLPDVLVVLSSANEQSLRGCLDVIDRASKARDRLPVARPRPLVLSVASRFDDREEYDEAARWLERFAGAWADHFAVWAPSGTEPRKLLNLLRIPYISKWSFGESLPARHERIDDPGLISWSIANVAACLAHGLGDGATLVSNRDEYVRAVAGGSMRPRPVPGHDALLIYPSGDLLTARSFYDALTRQGLNVVADFAAASPGEGWAQWFEHSVSTSRAVIALVTENLRASAWAQNELVTALTLRSATDPRIVAVALGPTVIPEGLVGLPVIRADEDLDAAARAVVGFIDPPTRSPRPQLER